MMRNLVVILFLFAFLNGFGQSKKIVVAQDGSGNYKTVQAAFDAVPNNNKKPLTIYVKTVFIRKNYTLIHQKTLLI